jgi:hypothetical protein
MDVVAVQSSSMQRGDAILLLDSDARNKPGRRKCDPMNDSNHNGSTGLRRWENTLYGGDSRSRLFFAPLDENVVPLHAIPARRTQIRIQRS